MKLDTLDLRILAELQADGSLSNVELARRVHERAAALGKRAASVAGLC